ncbi:hypothetical protein ACGFZL_01925 [Streptomyces sp. NPDC048182]|uniref:hypothetical protein n=1 Tax=Streptomyces sp. NPDC048182 TaxID=3365507 RepID=UPI00371461F9
MRVFRGVRQGGRTRRAVLAAVGAAVAVVGVAACDPGGLNSATVAYTTDQTMTRELDRRQIDVERLTCTASVGDRGGSASATPADVASVECRGETRDGRDIAVDGQVTRVVDRACVRGLLVAKVGGKERLRVSGLGDCDATSAPPGGSGGGQGPGPTVTVTRTIWCPEDPHCRPVEGK